MDYLFSKIYYIRIIILIYLINFFNKNFKIFPKTINYLIISYFKINILKSFYIYQIFTK